LLKVFRVLIGKSLPEKDQHNETNIKSTNQQDDKTHFIPYYFTQIFCSSITKFCWRAKKMIGCAELSSIRSSNLQAHARKAFPARMQRVRSRALGDRRL
jgi:hypothetical protein